MAIKWNGKTIARRDIGQAMMRDLVKTLGAEISERICEIRDPKTGEFPTVVIHGEKLEDLSFTIEGSAELLEIVTQRFSDEERSAMTLVPTAATAPKAFLSYAFNDKALAQSLAKALQANGIDTFWAGWSIGPGDRL